MAYIQLWGQWVTDSLPSAWPMGAELVSHIRCPATSCRLYLHRLGPSPITSHMHDGESIGLPSLEPHPTVLISGIYTDIFTDEIIQ